MVAAGLFGTSEMPELIQTLTAVIAFIVWLVRLEMKMRRNAEHIALIESQSMRYIEKQDIRYEKIIEEVGAIRSYLARIEGRINGKETRK